MSMNTAKDLFQWLAHDELTKEEILEMLTEEMCAELIVKHNAPYLEKNGDNYDYRYDGEIVGSFKAPDVKKIFLLKCLHESRFGADAFASIHSSREDAEKYVDTVKLDSGYLDEEGRDDNRFTYDIDEVDGTFMASKIAPERLETLLYNAISCLEDYECDGAQLEADIGITEEEYEAIMETNVENAFFTYDISFNYTVNGYSFDASVLDTKLNNSECVKPDLQCTANIIRSYLSAFYKGNELLEAVESINAIEVLVERNGEYFDRDEAEEETIKEIIALAKAPLLKPSLEGQVQQAQIHKENTGKSEPVEKGDMVR